MYVNSSRGNFKIQAIVGEYDLQNLCSHCSITLHFIIDGKGAAGLSPSGMIPYNLLKYSPTLSHLIHVFCVSSPIQSSIWLTLKLYTRSEKGISYTELCIILWNWVFKGTNWCSDRISSSMCNSDVSCVSASWRVKFFFPLFQGFLAWVMKPPTIIHCTSQLRSLMIQGWHGTKNSASHSHRQNKAAESN